MASTSSVNIANAAVITIDIESISGRLADMDAGALASPDTVNALHKWGVEFSAKVESQGGWGAISLYHGGGAELSGEEAVSGFFNEDILQPIKDATSGVTLKDAAKAYLVMQELWIKWSAPKAAIGTGRAFDSLLDEHGSIKTDSADALVSSIKVHNRHSLGVMYASMPKHEQDAFNAKHALIDGEQALLTSVINFKEADPKVDKAVISSNNETWASIIKKVYGIGPQAAESTLLPPPPVPQYTDRAPPHSSANLMDDLDALSKTASNVTSLNLSSKLINMKKDLPNVFKFIAEKLPYLVHLDLSENGLTYADLNKIKGEVKKLVKLERLNLSKNALASVPLEVGELVSLKALDLSGNKLKKLPLSLSGLSGAPKYKQGQAQGLKNLEKLDLSGNAFTGMTKCITGMGWLKVLKMSNNRMKSVPDRVGAMTGLTDLDVRGNQLMKVSDKIGALSNLKNLDVSYNRYLTEMPASISGIRGLTITADSAIAQLDALKDLIVKTAVAQRT